MLGPALVLLLVASAHASTLRAEDASLLERSQRWVDRVPKMGAAKGRNSWKGKRTSGVRDMLYGEPEPELCPLCNYGQCPVVDRCLGGITWDPCGCCETCAKTLGEECGGPRDAYGQCGLGMSCLKDSRQCPYLFPIQRGSREGCSRYLVNAIGRCVPVKRLQLRGINFIKNKRSRHAYLIRQIPGAEVPGKSE